MFTRNSRYFKEPNVVIEDQSGEPRLVKSLRLLPQVTGTFQHTVEENDRLDHLAYKYYQQTLDWWHICDANPQMLSPLALLGKEPIVTLQISLDSNSDVPWPTLRAELMSHVGIEAVELREEIQLIPRFVEMEGERIPHAEEEREQFLFVTINVTQIEPTELLAILTGQGYQQSQAEQRTQLGKSLTIPPGRR